MRSRRLLEEIEAQKSTAGCGRGGRTGRRELLFLAAESTSPGDADEELGPQREAVHRKRQVLQKHGGRKV